MVNEQLVALIRAGENEAENMLQLWKQNKGFIYQIARKYSGYAEIDDLCQEGYIGLCEAVQHYDSNSGVPFIHYAAIWIRQAIGRYVKSNGVIRIPEHVGNRVRAYHKVVKQWQMEYGRKPTEWEICRYLDVSLEVARQIEKDAQIGQIQSLDVAIGEEEDGTMYDLVPDPGNLEESVLNCVQKEQMRATVWSVVDSLQEQQAAVIRMRYQYESTLKETGKAIGVNTERARTIEAKALRELRKPARSRQLRPFMDVDRIYSRALCGNGVESFNRTWTSSTEREAIMLEEWETRYSSGTKKHGKSV